MRQGILATPEESLQSALHDLLEDPIGSVLLAWNWKAAMVSALLRAGTFFLSDLHAGRHQAVRAGVVEACFAIVAAGLLAAITQRLRSARPVWATAMFVWLGLPLLLVPLQALVHRLAGTTYVRTGLVFSFCFAALASGFTWSLQRRGFFLAGIASPLGRR